MSFVDPKGPHPGAARHRLHGVYSALVEKVTDPNGQGRVLVKLPWIAEDDMSQAMAWARIATLMAGGGRGTWFIPQKGDEVLVAFIAGDPRWPVVVGALWNGVDAPPETMDGGGENNIRSITSRAGHKLTFDDTSGAEKVEVVTNGQHRLTLDDQSREIVLHHSGGAEIKIDQAGTVSITAMNQVQVDAPAGMTVTAAQVTVNAAISKFSGVVKADSVITNAVISPSYTPGAGNVW